MLVIDATEVDKAVNAERWRSLVPGGTYPPIACILAKTNALAKERVDELIKWVRDKLLIKHVIPMRTFQVLTVEARRAYLDADVMSILRKDFNVDWKKTHMSALEALEALIKVIKWLLTKLKENRDNRGVITRQQGILQFRLQNEGTVAQPV